MIASAVNHEQSQQIDIFITHSNNKLVHKWIQNNVLHSQFVISNVASRAYVIKSGETYHIFFVNCSKQLIYLTRCYDSEEEVWINEQSILDYEVSDCDHVCIVKESYFYLFYINGQAQMISTIISKKKQSTIKKVISHKTKEFKIIKITEPMLFICAFDRLGLAYGLLNLDSDNQVGWNTIKIEQINEISHLDIKVNQQTCEILLVNSKLDLQLIAISYLLNSHVSSILQQSQSDLVVIKSVFLKINGQIFQIQISEDKRYKKKLLFDLGRKIKDFTVIQQNQTLHSFQIDINQTLTHHWKSLFQWKTRQQKQSLDWEDIKQDCQPIGDKGWHADAFYNKKIGLVVKKMRNPISYLINNEISSLQYLSAYLPIKCHHRIINNGAIGGLTMNYITGCKWDTILQKEGNMFAVSPISRVLFVIKLTKIIRILQQNRFCHGDLHLSNILIDTKKQDILNPQFEIQVIDFGNGFVFEPNKLVSKGLTGLQIIIPFEVQSVRKKNYNPIGINSHQLGRNALQILLLSKHCQVNKLEYSPQKQLKLLQQKKQYPKQMSLFLKGLLHQDPYQRNHHLFTTNIDDLQQKTRIIYQLQHDHLMS